MSRTRSRAALWTAAACALLALPALAEPDPAGEVAARAAKDLARAESYRVNATVRGGKASSADHTLVATTVDESYAAEVTGKLCALTSPCQAFRLRADAAKGAVREGTRWMAILATDAGRKSARLFPGPEAVLARALRWKQKAAWVAPTAPLPGAPAGGQVQAGGDEEQEPAGTRTGGKDAPAEAPAAPVSHHIRIEAPAQVAVETFIEITNSGCFAEG